MDTNQYLQNVSIFDENELARQQKAQADNMKETLKAQEEAGIELPISEALIQKSLSSQSLKNAIKNFFKTGDVDVDKAVSNLVDGDNPIDIADGLIKSKLRPRINNAINSIKGKVNKFLSDNDLDINDIQGTAIHKFSQLVSRVNPQGQEEIEMQEIQPTDLNQMAVDNLANPASTGEEEEGIEMQELRPEENIDNFPTGSGGRVTLSQGQEEDNVINDIDEAKQNTFKTDFEDGIKTGSQNIEDIGEGIGEGISDAVGNVGDAVGDAVDGALEGAGAVLDLDPITAGLGLLLGLGGLAGSITNLFDHHDEHPDIDQLPVPVFESGI
jgi:hypothetical protein